MNNKYHKTLGPQAARLVTTLYEKNKPIFRLADVQKILHIEAPSSRNFVRKLIDRGIVTRLKPGLYILVPFELGREREYMGNPLVVAREIVNGKDYYLSHGTAMEIQGMVTQPRLIVYVTTPIIRKSINIMGVQFKFVSCKKNSLFGISDHWVTKQEKVKISDLERTIIDGLKHSEYCGGLTEVAKGLWIRKEDIDINKLIGYAVKVNIGAVIRRLGYLLELYKIGTSIDWDILQHHLTETYTLLDPSLAANGKYLRKWRLKLNVSAEELLNVVRT